MPALSITLNLESDPWEDLKLRSEEGRLVHLKDAPMRVGALPRGMQSGKASVAIAIELPDGRTVVAETSLELFLAAARVFQVGRDRGELL